MIFLDKPVSTDNRWPDPLEDPNAQSIRNLSTDGMDPTTLFDLFDRMEREIKYLREIVRQ